MARHNIVSVFGMVLQDPIIIKDENGEFKKGHASIVIVRNKRDIGVEEDDALKYDNPILYSGDPKIIEQMAQLKINDLVEVKGFLTTMDIKKKTTCKHCRELHPDDPNAGVNYIQGSMDFISPVYLDIRKTGSTERESLIELKKHMEISNQVLLVGNLCSDVAFYRDGKLKTSKYQLAVNRKYFLNDGQPNVRSDYPFIITFGENAVLDYECLHVGSRILVDGRLQTREFTRKTQCAHCGQSYEWNDRVIEVIPYSVEYLADFISPEEVEAKKQAELEALREQIKM